MPTKMPEAKQANVATIGGAFIYANDPKALALWYRDNLGMEFADSGECANYHHIFPHDEKVPGVVFAIRKSESKLPKDKKQFVVNFIVNDFDGFIARLKAKGVAIDKTEDYPGFGRFGWIKDLEGNPIEFWQPKK